MDLVYSSGRQDWIWQASDTLAEYTAWAPNEPDANDSRNCAFFNKEVGYKWTTGDCDNEQLSLFCEKKVARLCLVIDFHFYNNIIIIVNMVMYEYIFFK